MPKTTKIAVRQEAHPDVRETSPAPWARLGSLRDEIDRLFGAFEPRQWFDRPFGMLAGADVLCPAMDLTENGTGYSITMEIPGIDPANVEVKVSNGTLSVSGEKTEEKTDRGEDYHVSERRWGSFRRSVRLPDNLDRDKINASHANGVLTITLPKSADARASERTIQVKAA